MPKYFLIKGLNHGFYVDFVLIILICEMYHLNLRVQIDFVLVMLELKPVHRCDYHIEFLHLNGARLILCYLFHVLIWFCVFHVALCIWFLLFLMKESFALLFQYS